jgi:predicted CopG family antitoxin
MLHELIITVDDDVYQTLKPMVEQQTISSLFHEFVQTRISEPPVRERPIPAIAALRGTLHQVDTSDIRDEADRSL